VHFVVGIDRQFGALTLFQSFEDAHDHLVYLGDVITRAVCRPKPAGQSFQAWFQEDVKPMVEAAVALYEADHPDKKLSWDGVEPPV
jgi:hypothetical protein